MKTLHLKISKTKIIYLVLIAFAITITSCQKPHKPDKPAQEDNDTREKLLEKIITLEDAVDKYKKYSDDRIDLLKETLERRYEPGFEDTRTVWFDIEIIQEYLDYVKEESKKVGIEPKGVQFYFGVISNKETSQKKNHQTFFVAPTKTNDPESGYTLDANGKPILLKDKLKDNYESSPNQKNEKAGFFTVIQPGGKGLLLNDGKPNPPGDNN